MITDEQYEEFVRTLIKPSEQLDAEVTEDEKNLLLISVSLINNSLKSCRDPKCKRPGYLNLLHMMCGLASEAGELVDAIKKIVIYRKPVGSIYTPNSIAWNVKEEVGDLCWFQTGNKIIREVENQETTEDDFWENLKYFLYQWNKMYPDNIITIESAKQFNMEKLSIRYKELKYSNESAQKRADKEE